MTQSVCPPLTVCIVTHRRPDLLATLLETLCRSELPESYTGILVVENGGCDESRSVVERLPSRYRVRHLTCSSRAKCAALNLAITQITDGLVVFIDDDAVPGEGWLAAYAAAYETYGSGHYFGGPTDPGYDVVPPAWLRRFLPGSASGFTLSDEGPQSLPCYFLGFNWAAEAEALRACGGFSLRFGPGTELGVGDESLMQYQLGEHDVVPVYVQAARVRHYVPVERCSASWALGKAVAGGFCAGILHEQYQRRHSRPIRAWKAALRRTMRLSQWSDVTRLLTLRPAGIYWSRRSVAAARSFVAGVAYGAEHHPLDQANWTSDGLGNGMFPPHDESLPRSQRADVEMPRPTAGSSGTNAADELVGSLPRGSQTS